MKKQILLTILMCLTLSMTACAGRDDSLNGSYDSSSNENSNSDSSADSSGTGSAGSANGVQDTTQPKPTVLPSVKRPEILKNAVLVDEEKLLSYIPNSAIEEHLMQEIAFFQGKLLSISYSYDAETNIETLCLKLLSLDSGEILYETEFQTAGSYAVKVQVCNDRIAVSDALSGIIYVLNDKLEQINTYDASGDTIYVNPSVTEAYCFASTDGIHILDLNRKEERVILGNASDLSVLCYSENCICIRYIDLSAADKKECYAGINLETGEIEMLEIDDSYSSMEYSEGIWVSQLIADDNLYFVGTQQDPYKFSLHASYPLMYLVGEPARLIIATTELDGSQNMAAYGTDGTFLSACSMKDIDGTLWSKPIWLESANGYFFIMIDNAGYDKLYFWDLSKEIEGDDLELLSYYEEKDLGGEVLEQKYYERAKMLSEKYGATIKIADQCSTDYLDKTAIQECDPVKIEAALEVLEKTISSYPDGFFKQLYYGPYRKMEINLMGAISHKEEIEGHTPSAFVQAVNGKITMVMNINHSADSLEQTFYHESSHIIDQVLEHDALYREDALYSEEKWWSYNPEEFIQLNPEMGGYYGSYEIMPMEYFQESFTSYFMWDYAKSFSTEDRATIFEEAMTGDYTRFSPQISNPLYEKLLYYCACIRDCFDTAGWPEYTTWELALRNIES